MRSPLLKIEVVDLEKLVELKKRRDDLKAQMDAVDREIEAIVGHAGGGEHHVDRRHKGEIKNKVLDALREAGDKGMNTGDMAKKVGLPRTTLEKFLYSRSARETKGLIKIGTATFKYVDPAKAPPPAGSSKRASGGPTVHEHRRARPAAASLH